VTPRDRRLISDLRQMEALAERGAIDFRADGNPPEAYHLMLHAPGVSVREKVLARRETHRCDVYLHRDYPRRPPVVVWATPVFHPNLLGPDRNGGVCIGSWSASEGLGDLVERLIGLVSWRSVNPDDPLDRDAAAWVKERGFEPGVEIDRLIAAWTPADAARTKVEA